MCFPFIIILLTTCNIFAHIEAMYLYKHVLVMRMPLNVLKTSRIILYTLFSHDNAMKVFEDTTDYNSKQPEKDEEPEYPKEVHTMCLIIFEWFTWAKWNISWRITPQTSCYCLMFYWYRWFIGIHSSPKEVHIDSPQLSGWPWVTDPDLRSCLFCQMVLTAICRRPHSKIPFCLLRVTHKTNWQNLNDLRLGSVT